MSAASSAIFSNVTKQKLLPLYNSHGATDAKRVVEFLQFTNADVAKISDVSRSSVRFEPERIPDSVQERMVEIANICEIVADNFGGDAERTALWFREKNAMLGGITPKDMIRFGRYQKLLQILMDFKNGNIA